MTTLETDDTVTKDIEKELSRIERESKLAESKVEAPQENTVDVEEATPEPEPEQEPLEKTVESVDLTSVPKDPPKFVSWKNIKLNLVLKLEDPNEEREDIVEHNGQMYYLNKPFSSYRKQVEGPNGKEEVKYKGYLSTYLKSFCKDMSSVANTINSQERFGTNTESDIYFKEVAVYIMEKMDFLLPKRAEANIDFYCDLKRGKNSFIETMTLEFFLVCRTNYKAEDALDWGKRLSVGLSKLKKSKAKFNMQTTMVIPLSYIPDNFVPLKEAGWVSSNYEDTDSLPKSRDDRLNITGALENTKRASPCVILTKQFI